MLLTLLLALAAAAFLWLPYLLWRDDEPHEWSGIVMLWHTAEVAVGLLLVALVSRAIGRARPWMRVCARGLVLGTTMGLVIFPVLLMLLPQPV